jgi:glycosyltransferase involved in cell wall biosynthesis
MTGPLTETVANPSWEQAPCARLSILIPFFKDDPQPLLHALAAQAMPGTEIILCDDGRPDAALNSAVAETVLALETPVLLLSSRVNRGRSAARNRMAQAARGGWVLFLDADMEPGPDFLLRWLLALENTRADALFGGYAPAAPDRKTHVHARLAAASDPVDAAARVRIGATAVCSSNLAVRREVIASVPFHEDYAGWGWEDVDWALCAAQQFQLSHIDNPAAHAGLETVDELLAKFSRSGENFARLLHRHPDYAARPGARLARMLRGFRAAGLARFVGAAAARAPLPTRLRVIGLKLYRAGVNAAALTL